MPTKSERQALAFLAVIAMLGAGVRATSARRFLSDVNEATGGAVQTDSASPAARALAHQIAAVDSARLVRALSSGRARGSRSSRSLAKPSSARDAVPTPTRGPRRATRAPPSGQLDEPVDINHASAAELERLPRVGPALAKRIIAWRKRHGPFESAESLRHVPGIGVTTSSLLEPLVTFSSGHRP